METDKHIRTHEVPPATAEHFKATCRELARMLLHGDTLDDIVTRSTKLLPRAQITYITDLIGSTSEQQARFIQEWFVPTDVGDIIPRDYSPTEFELLYRQQRRLAQERRELE